jgi:hypothetical protein
VHIPGILKTLRAHSAKKVAEGWIVLGIIDCWLGEHWDYEFLKFFSEDNNIDNFTVQCFYVGRKNCEKFSC